MKNILILSAALFTLAFSACKDDEMKLAEVTDVQLDIKANYEGQTFMTEKEYAYGDMNIKFNKLDFYLADIVLTKTPADGGGEIELSEIEFIDLTFNINQQTQAEEGVRLNIKDVDVGEYSGIRMGIGVPADLNRTTWTDYASGHPLRNDSHYWASWNSFIFAKIEGKVDADKDGTFESSFVFHTGSDEAYTEKNAGELISLVENETKNISLNINVKELLKAGLSACDDNADGYIDVDNTECSKTHSLSQLPLVKSIMSNFRAAITMN